MLTAAPSMYPCSYLDSEIRTAHETPNPGLLLTRI
jgi:hypothetical protein